MFDGDTLLRDGQDINLLRARIGMVFQKPTPFPMTIYENIAFGIRLHEKLSRSQMDERVEWALTRAAIWGEVMFDGDNLLRDGQDINLLRARIGMVFQKPTPFPMSIYENIAFGIRLYENLPKSELDGRVEHALRRGALWDEVKDKLNASGLSLSGGQQQRLCIARTVAVKPEVILFDEPCSALDPISTAKIEELIDELKQDYTIVIVTHNMQQAARVSDFTAFMYLGELVEFGATATLFTTPTDKRTQAYITGRFG